MSASRRRAGPLLQRVRDRAATGKSGGTKVWAEDQSVLRQQFRYLELPADTTRSTIAVAFNTDGNMFASTHGDHTVKITRFMDGKVMQTLRGHPRTPWTVKFHPKDSRIVASGCLGFEVKVWNTTTGQCLHTAALEAAIISLSFHPSGNMLAIASGQFVYLWDYNNKPHPYSEWGHPHIIRCVRFTPDGCSIIIGAGNSSPSWLPQNQSATGGSRGDRGGSATAHREVTFRLLLWDFRLGAAAQENRTAFSRPRVLLHQTLLYNDGGFDVSQDGLWLCAIAELWKAVDEPVVPLLTGKIDVSILKSKSTAISKKPVRETAGAFAASNFARKPAWRPAVRPEKHLVPTFPEVTGHETKTVVENNGTAASSSSSNGRHSSPSTTSSDTPHLRPCNDAPPRQSIGRVPRSPHRPISTVSEPVSVVHEPARRLRESAEQNPTRATAALGERTQKREPQGIPHRLGSSSPAGPRVLPPTAAAEEAGTMEVVEYVGEPMGRGAGQGGQASHDVRPPASMPVDGDGRMVQAPPNGSKLQGNGQTIGSDSATEGAGAEQTPSTVPPPPLLQPPPPLPPLPEVKGITSYRDEGKRNERGLVFKPWPIRTGYWQHVECIRGSSRWVAVPATTAAATPEGGTNCRHSSTGNVFDASGGGEIPPLTVYTPTGSTRLESTPRTPSPRIGLKRPRSAAWLSGGCARSGRTGNRGGPACVWIRERKGRSLSRTGQTTKVVTTVGALCKAHVEGGGSGGGGDGAVVSSRICLAGGGDSTLRDDHRRCPPLLAAPRDEHEASGVSSGGAALKTEGGVLSVQGGGGKGRDSPRWGSRVHKHAAEYEGGEFPLPLLQPPRVSSPAVGIRVAGAFRSPAAPSSSVSGSGDSLRITLPQSPPSDGARSLPVAVSRASEGSEGEPAIAAQQAHQEGQQRAQHESGTVVGDRGQLLTPPPLFFLQVPTTGASRVDTPWAGGPVRLRRASVCAAAVQRDEAGEGLGRELEAGGRARAVGDAMASALADEVANVTAAHVPAMANWTSAAVAGVVGNRGMQRSGGNTSAGGSTGAVGTQTGRAGLVSAEARGMRAEGDGSSGDDGGAAGGGVDEGGGDRRTSSGTAPPIGNRTGKFVPHLVLVSLHAEGVDGRQARVVRAAAMDSIIAKQVTSVKLSPSARYILLGAGVRARYAENREGPEARGSERRGEVEERAAEIQEGAGAHGGEAQGNHPTGVGGGGTPSQPPVTSIYRAADLQPVNMMPSADDDVNIACFHPEPGMGCVYGTKQGRVCVVRMGD